MDYHAPEQVEEPERLENDAKERPFEEYEKYTAEEAQTASYFIFSCEEIKCLLRSDNET
jgi:hypothetical protein